MHALDGNPICKFFFNAGGSRYLVWICIVSQHLRRSGLCRKHVGQQCCCYEERSDVAPAAHRGILQYICSDTRKLASWLSPTSFVDRAAYHQTPGQRVQRAPPAPNTPRVQARRKCAPLLAPVI